MYMYVYIYVYMYIYICMYVCMYVYIYMYMYIYVYMYMYMYMYIYVYVYVYMYMCVYGYYVCVCIYFLLHFPFLSQNHISVMFDTYRIFNYFLIMVTSNYLGCIIFDNALCFQRFFPFSNTYLYVFFVN